MIVKRQLTLLERLLNADGPLRFPRLAALVEADYSSRKVPVNAIIRDVNRLFDLGAVDIVRRDKTAPMTLSQFEIAVQIDWPSKITETEFFDRLAHLPKAKTYRFLSPEEA